MLGFWCSKAWIGAAVVGSGRCGMCGTWDVLWASEDMLGERGWGKREKVNALSRVEVISDAASLEAARVLVYAY